ncbi:sterol regulatory element-binding ECM22 [Fusarium pseudocircinatum]|uniref:Sterol regulatory element-binding ECM22 n=1 Tax=Fusarium pseudocircinatum TaxID=56676 RepID=A0A8H5UL47_9HYPO|nr:sterol regulatory element-binding ECM22 [Fusarium pseudocircinatum]
MAVKLARNEGSSFDTASDAGTKTTFVPIRPRQRGRPVALASDAGTSTQALVPMPMDSQLSSPSRQSLSLNVDDLRLYHHYITVTSLSFGDDAMWHDKIPLLAFDNNFILHLMLAVSGLHLARLQAPEETKYEKLAEHHHSKAVSHVTNLLPQIDHQNCSALYIATVLICNYAFAKPPKKGHLLVQSHDTETAWWNLFRGIRFVIETMGIKAIFSGPIGPFPPKAASAIPPAIGRTGYIAWEKPLADLKTMIHDSQTPMLPDLLELYEALVCCFSGVFGTADEPQNDTHGKTHIVMRWVWFLDDDFTKQVEKLNPQVLVLLAYFSVLVQTLECFWYMRGWSWRILESITEQLDPDYAAWITWPRDQLESELENLLLLLEARKVQRFQARVLKELMAILENIQPGITLNL